MQNKLYAIILNYNTADDCMNCVQFLTKQNYSFLRITIIDNNSTRENQKEKLLEIKENFGVDVIFNEHNSGYSAGNNIGLRYAIQNGAEWCLIVNPDVVIDNPNYISNMMEVIQQYKDVVVAASKMLLPNGERQNPYREINYSQELFWFFDAIQQRLGKTKSYLLADTTGYCPKVSGCCFFIKTSFLKEIGYLDENVFLYCEEPILASQVKQLGYNELYVSELYAYHNHVPSQKGKTSDRMIKLLDSRIYYLKKYSGYTGLLLKLVLFSKRLQKIFWRIKG